MATAVVLVIIIAAVAAATVKIIKDKSKGKCTGCPYAGTCQKHSCPSSDKSGE